MEIVIGIASLIIAWLTFKYTFFSKPKQELLALKVQFKSNQAISLELQDEIEKLMKENNAENSYIFNGITYEKYLNFLKENHKKCLSDELFNKIDKMELNKSIIQSMSQSLDKQFSELQDILNTVKMKHS